jgi:hypothetical protein
MSSIVCPRRFLCLYYITANLCTNLASRLKLSPNRPKWSSTWPMSPRSSIGCAKYNFQAYWTFSANRAPILRRYWHYHHVDQNKLVVDARHAGVELVHPNWFLSLWSLWGKLCTYLTSRLTISPSGSNRASIWPRNLGVPSGLAKKNCMPMVRSVKTVHLSDAEINTVSMWTKANFDLTNVTYEYHRVRTKWFLSPLHI